MRWVDQATTAHESKIQHASPRAYQSAPSSGEFSRETELRREIGRYQRDRHEAYVRDFLKPMLVNLAQKMAGPNAKIRLDET